MSVLTQQEVGAAVDAFIGTYNSSRSAYLGYRYVSPSLLASDRHLGDAVRMLLAPIYDEVERLTEHSKRWRSELERLRAEADPPRPTIVVLCGSTRFSEAFQRANFLETLAGRIVLTIGCDMRSDEQLFACFSEAERSRIKAELDQLHKRKIELADELLVLNVGGYVGESTRAEIEHGQRLGKRIRWWAPLYQESDIS